MKTLRMVVWQEEYSVKDAHLDAQHQQIVDLINCLFSAHATGGTEKIVYETFEDLVRYTETHFRDEELIMKEHSYPELDAHKAVHAKMALRTRELRAECEKMRGDYFLETLHFLKDWWTKHILSVDQKYVPFLLK